MSFFAALKLVHVTCALVSVAGFTLRGYWAVTENPLRQMRIARVLPHVVDSLLLGSALGMLLLWQISPLALPWVMAKLVALLIYIALGMAVMRFAQTRRARLLAYWGALATAAYILAAAVTHSPLGPLALWRP